MACQHAPVPTSVPSADLGLWRTPAEPAPGLAERLGLGAADLLVKRDDWLGHGGGGNKLRKLARLCGAALHEGADVLVTSGAAQSNHARATAAAARRLGLDVVLVLAGDAPAGGASGNLALDGLLGARVVWAGPVGEAGHAALDARLAATVAELRGAGRHPYLVPYGGSSGLGASGYLEAARELEAQVPDVDHVVCAVGSGGTMAGLVAGLGPQRVLGVHVGAVAEPEAAVRRLLGELAEQEGTPDGTGEGLRLRLDQVGEAYGTPSAASRAAMDDAALGAGIVLDPVYTAKAMAGLAAEVADGAIRRGQRTVFLHSGGLPGFFGHPIAAELAARTAG